MSRIGRLPITVPSDVEVKIDGPVVTVKGAKGELVHTVASPIEVSLEDAILSTSSGLLTDRQASKKGVGGEVLAYVW
ncbi:hypothetical protein CTI14_53795 [Methylobacterium radiotolerans]|nr:hypothetical protein CTI14_53795 [Methylobacterium radiotolerans]